VGEIFLLLPSPSLFSTLNEPDVTVNTLTYAQRI